MPMASQNSTHTQAEERSIQLRAELKHWERDFAASHGGRKAGRDDIKQHAEIASKYKTYDKLRNSLSQPSKPNFNITSPVPSRKRPSSVREDTQLPTIQTPSKRAKHAHPLHSHPVHPHNPFHPANLDPYDAPISTFLSPSRARTSLGPTPQKDGTILGLFDGLSTGGSADRTPSKRNTLLPTAGNVQATPSKRAGTRMMPGSASKMPRIGAVITPSTHRVTKAHSTPASSSSVRKLRFDETPAFLRRDSQRTAFPGIEGGDGLDEGDGVSFSPIAFRRLPRPTAGRGLSALVKGLRDMQEAKLDDDLDMLREMEGESTFESFASKMNHQQTKTQPPKVLVGDSQIPDMPLGPDGAVESEEEVGVSEGKTRDGRPLKVWKKKGQKRTTRAVKMRPNAAKWKPEPAWRGGVEEEDGVEGEEVVGETQMVDSNPTAAIGESAGLYEEDDYTGGLGDEDEYAAHPDADAESEDMDSKMAAWRKQKKDLKQAKEDGKKDGIVQKVKKKISATAHANFRALKIRGKGVQGKKPSGRFGKRR